MSEVSEGLTRTKRLIESDGWIQGDLHNSDGYCLMGALCHEVENAQVRLACGVALLEAIDRYTLGGASIISFNDYRGRTVEQIYRVLDEAIDAERRLS